MLRKTWQGLAAYGVKNVFLQLFPRLTPRNDSHMHKVNEAQMASPRSAAHLAVPVAMLSLPFTVLVACGSMDTEAVDTVMESNQALDEAARTPAMSAAPPTIPSCFCIDWAPYNVAGTARFSNGEVVDHALIEVYKNGSMQPSNLIGSGYTNPDGSYRINLTGGPPTYVEYNYPIGGGYAAYANSTPCCTGTSTYNWERSFQAGPPSGYIKGRITFDGGNPPAGSKVIWSGAVNGQVTTAADGTYRTSNMFNGSYIVTAWAGNIVSSTATITVNTNANTRDWALLRPPLAVSISRSGSTLTANATGGTPGYSYEWSYYSLCNGPGPIEDPAALETSMNSFYGASPKLDAPANAMQGQIEPPNLEPCGYWWGPFYPTTPNQFYYHSCNCRLYRVRVADAAGRQAEATY